MLAALAADPTASFTDLSRPAREALSFAHPDAAITFLLSWRTKTDPLAAAVDPLIDFGAAVHSRGRVTITPLGHWALETLRARAPRPISIDLAATELLARLTQIDEDEQWYAAQTWLAGRAPLPASRDLLAAAATATPAQRLAAVELVHALGPRADAAWGEAAALPNLAAHVRLARDDLDEKAADWLAVEYAAAALPDHGPDEVLARLDDRFTGIGRDFRPEVIERTAHPAAAEDGSAGRRRTRDVAARGSGPARCRSPRPSPANARSSTRRQPPRRTGAAGQGQLGQRRCRARRSGRVGGGARGRTSQRSGVATMSCRGPAPPPLRRPVGCRAIVTARARSGPERVHCHVPGPDRRAVGEQQVSAASPARRRRPQAPSRRAPRPGRRRPRRWRGPAPRRRRVPIGASRVTGS